MRYRRLDESRDMTFGHGLADFIIDTPEAPAQAVITRLGLWAGEWYLDIEEGTPYQGGVLGMHTRDSYDTVIRERILSTQGVTELISYESSINADTRELEVLATIATQYGETTVAGVL